MWGTNAVDLDMIGFSICTQELAFLTTFRLGIMKANNLIRKYVLDRVKPLFEDESIEKIAHHTKFDQMVMAQHGIQERGMIFDTILAANLVKERMAKECA